MSECDNVTQGDMWEAVYPSFDAKGQQSFLRRTVGIELKYIRNRRIKDERKNK